jgi:hypothetical protein
MWGVAIVEQAETVLMGCSQEAARWSLWCRARGLGGAEVYMDILSGCVTISIASLSIHLMHNEDLMHNEIAYT